MTATFGYVLPSSEGSDVPSAEQIYEIAEFCDASSYEHLWVSDHILWWLPMHDSLTLLAALAARTSRIRLGPAVLLLAMRDPVLVAKALATIDRLSGGRLTVGVGVGGELPSEWEAVGAKTRTRGKRTDEMIAALRGLWGAGPFTLEGKHLSIEQVDLHPKPAVQPPIWVGGRSTQAMSRAARDGDGWMGIFLTPERYREAVAVLEVQAIQNDRDPTTIRRSLYVWTAIAERESEARQNAQLLSDFYNVPFEKIGKYAVVGTAEQCAEQLAEYVGAGAQDFALAPIFPAVSTEPAERLEAVARLVNNT
ncbi:MAG TPA: LLM class flavin-dependent oxidoreductase [Actinomycetota bacterium]|nr:LLM class flavin-dependent oxidoreductase [Actinomycetota bacterium]